jgi:cell wall-associated NlpC family hydrolase
MFEPEDQPTSTAEPGREEDSILQRYLSQLGMPVGTGLRPVNDLPPNDSPTNWRLPRFYGAPPDHSPSNTSALNSPQSEGPANDLERVRFLLKMSDNCVGRPSVPLVGRGPAMFSTPAGPNTQDKEISPNQDPNNNSLRPDYSAYLTPGADRFFSSNNFGNSVQNSFPNAGIANPRVAGESTQAIAVRPQGIMERGNAASTQTSAPQTRKTDPDNPVIQPTKELKDYGNLAHSVVWPYVPDNDKKKLADLLDQGQTTAANSYAREVARQFIAKNPEFASFDRPGWVYVDPNVPGHNMKYVVPGDPDDKRWPELKAVLAPHAWEAIPGEDKYRLSQLMTDGKFDEANQYAQAVRTGRWPAGRPVGPPDPFTPTYPGLSVDNLVHSPQWQKVSPQVKNSLGAQIAMGNMEAADTLAKTITESLKAAKTTPVNSLSSLKNSEMWASISKDDKAKLDDLIKKGNQPAADQYAHGLAIAETAKRYEGNKQWAVEVTKDKFKSGDDKCNEFVFDVMREMGLEVPGIAGWSGRLFGLGGPPAASQWADRSKKRIGNWEIVDGPAQPGDVIAEFTGGTQNPNWAHVGIVVGNGKTASADTLVYPKGMIVINDWGFRPDDLDKEKKRTPGNDRIVRRYIPDTPHP